jgi:Arc/MetJ family transcription regulator
VVAETLIDVDEEELAAAQRVLQTETKKDTVNAALRAAPCHDACIPATRQERHNAHYGGQAISE